MNSSWISRIQPSSAMTHTARENSSKVWTRLITWKSSYKLSWINPVRANSTTIWFTTITIRFLYTINYTRNSHFRMNKWASLSRMELYLISKKNWTSSLIQWCKIKLKMNLDRLLSSKYSTIIWLSTTSWIVHSRSSKSNYPINIKCKVTWCKAISI